jgi:hypothetical protein
MRPSKVNTCKVAHGPASLFLGKVFKGGEHCDWRGETRASAVDAEKPKKTRSFATGGVLGASSYVPKSTSTCVLQAYEFSPIVPE